MNYFATIKILGHSAATHEALFVSAFRHFCWLAFGRSKSWMHLKLEKPNAHTEVLLAFGSIQLWDFSKGN
jgi:hypothetical protein